MFHLSERNLHGIVLTPRVPVNGAVDSKNENSSIERVCFSETIDGALLGLARNLEGQVLSVHSPEPNQALDIIPNKELIYWGLVYDAYYSKELWVTCPVKLRHLYNIEVGKAIDEYVMVNFNDRPTRAYYWNWRRIHESNP